MCVPVVRWCSTGSLLTLRPPQVGPVGLQHLCKQMGHHCLGYRRWRKPQVQQKQIQMLDRNNLSLKKVAAILPCLEQKEKCYIWELGECSGSETRKKKKRWYGLERPPGSVLQMRPLIWAGRHSLIARFRFQHVYKKKWAK